MSQPPPRQVSITHLQHRVLEILVTTGGSSQQIADQINAENHGVKMDESRVKVCLRELTIKLACGTRTELAVRALQLKLVALPVMKEQLVVMVELPTKSSRDRRPATLRALREQPDHAAELAAIARQLEVTYSATHQVLADLVNEGLAVRADRGRKARWQLTAAGLRQAAND